MTNCNAPEHQTTRRILLIAWNAALAVSLTLARWQPADARVTPPPVPTDIQVPAESKAFLEGHAIGTQNYFCLPAGAGFAWTPDAPQATLFTARNKQVMTHFLSPNPDEGGTFRFTWQHSRDTSTVWARSIATSPDPAFVAPGAIPWRLFQMAGAEDGPTGGHKLTATTFIQLVNTSGGVAPATGCALSGDLGKKALVPYTADYFFYK